MRPEQRETRFRMIEPAQVFPVRRHVAGLASRPRSVRPHFLHAFLELPLVGIFMAYRAGAIFELVQNDFLKLRRRALFVAIGARRR